MSRLTRWCIACASLAVLGVFAFPLWRVTLEAPQYPEGIGMLIHVDGVTGVKEHDLANINGLNHYIGMARIEPDAIPELRVMPWIAAAMVVTGLVVAGIGSRGLYIGWASVVLGTLAVGVYDFWRWEYSYGHNLRADAAIRIPGLSYQPPLFGSKQILNFVAHSYPDTGGWLLIAAAAAIGAVLLLLLFGAREVAVPAVRDSGGTSVVATGLSAAVGAVLLLASCSSAGPRALALGKEECAQCRMMITDARFGAQVVAPTGRVQPFDAIECAAAYAAAADSTRIRKVWVSDFEHPGTWLATSDAVFVIGAEVASPMGQAVLALGADADRSQIVARYGGRVSDWRSLVDGAAFVATSDRTRQADVRHAH
jgi:copper chaperone NosL